MKVTPRITIATGVIVAIAVGAWAYVDVREQDRARKQALEREGREVAGALRVTLEASTDWTRNAAAITRDLSRALAPWRVLVTPAPSGDPRERGGRTGNGDETLDE